MPTREDDTLREKLGFVQADIKHVSAQVEKIVGKVDEANTNIVKLNTLTVKQPECIQRTSIIAEKIDQLKEEVSKKQTRPENPTIRYDTAVFGTSKNFEESGKKSGRKPFAVKLKDNAAAILAVFTLLGLLITGIVKFAHVIVTIEETLAKNEKKEIKKSNELKDEIKKLRSERRKVIYIPVYKDSGPETRRSRRRFRRVRRDQ